MTATPLRRARPLLGTLVTLQLDDPSRDGPALQRAADAAFDTVAQIHHAMSAHEPTSDMARLARAAHGERIAVHPHTAAVLRLAQHWQDASAGAFDPEAAGRILGRRGDRPALVMAADSAGSLRGLQVVEGPAVLADGPVPLDLGGIAKGYAVDQAVAVLQAHGIASGLVNAGGDLRAFGPRSWRVELQHPVAWGRARSLLRLRNAAVATSLGGPANADFVAARRRRGPWQCATILARDCATADALTKWALHAPAPALQLRSALARAGARMWRA